MTIQIGPDLSVTRIEGSQIIYVSDVFRVKTVAPEVAAELRLQHFEEAARRFPELRAAIASHLKTNPLPPTTK